jgi:hypothetical protein
MCLRRLQYWQETLLQGDRRRIYESCDLRDGASRFVLATVGHITDFGYYASRHTIAPEYAGARVVDREFPVITSRNSTTR